MEQKCDGYCTTSCCGGTFKLGDICSICGEFADNQCEDCPQEDREQCENAE